MIKAAFLAPPETVASVYGKGRREQIEQRTDLLREIVRPDRLDDQLPLLREVEVIFSTWGMPSLTNLQIASLPHLRAVFYAAGSVQGFARPLLERGVRVISAWRGNAEAVAQFTLAQILLSTKGYFRNIVEYDGSSASFRASHRGAGSYGETIALLGCGAIGRRVIALLKPFDLKVIVFDPFLAEADARELGVERVITLGEAFERGYVVSNHLANKPETERMIQGDLFGRMRRDATFINTGRGKTVVESEMIEILRLRPDLIALLDVTDPEPMGEESPLRALPNVHVSAHIAGAIHDEVVRMADLCIAEFDRFTRGEPLQHEVTLEILARMA